jgi:hypothetical protein
MKNWGRREEVYIIKKDCSKVGPARLSPVILNPSYSGGRDQEDRGLKPASGK